MKKLSKSSLLVLAAGLILAGCDIGKPSPSVQPTPSTNPSVAPSETLPEVSTPDVSAFEELTVEDYKAYVLYDLTNVLASIGIDSLDAEVKAQVEQAYEAGLVAVNAAESYAAAQAAFEAAKAEMASKIPFADGLFSFVGLSGAEKTEILGLLEAYAVRNGITGISLFENGGYVMYSDRVVLGTENYIPGYGFGTLAEGSITADLANEENPAWKRYYHSINASDPGTANYLDDQGSEVSDFYGYFGASYFTTFMNSTKDGYDWVPELAKEKPVALDPDYATTGMSKKWRFEVKTGADGLKYTTNSTKEDRASYNNRPVELEDYLTPFKLLLTKKNDYFRGSEMAGQKGAGAIKGAKAYYDGSADGYNAELWADVGLKVYEEAGKTYFEYEYNVPTDDFYSMYYIASSLYMPVPQSFLDLVTVENYLGYNADKTYTPVDNSLSLGAYALETWNAGQEVVYKKNPNYVFADTKYSTPGVHVNILTAAADDPEAGIKEFLAGNTDSSGIPQTKLAEYKNDPRTRHTTGDSNFKLNVNATDAETWEYLFGENGVVTQTPKAQYWEVEPALGNNHFVKALSLAINRVEFADARGSIASVDYLSSNYMSDPVNGISYSTTQAHKAAVAGLLDQTDGCGYNLELAREYFKVALAELEASGEYTRGTAENPKVIELEIAWQYPQHETNYHKEIEQYLETAFNDLSVSNGAYQLDVKFWVGESWSDVYYNKMMLGQFDLGFGSISGNSLNPLDFLSVLSSDQALSGGFTLNWGTDTNNVEADILVYNGMRWSFDALWQAANGQAIVVGGENTPAHVVELASHEENTDGTWTSVINVELASTDLVSFEVTDLVVFWADYTSSADYFEESLMWTAEDVLSGNVVVSEVSEEGVITITITSSAEIAAKYAGNMGFDVYFNESVGGAEATEGYASVYAAFPSAE